MSHHSLTPLSEQPTNSTTGPQSPTVPSADGLEELDPILDISFEERTFFEDLDGLCPAAVDRLAGIAWDINPSQPIEALREAMNRLFDWTTSEITDAAADSSRDLVDTFEIPNPDAVGGAGGTTLAPDGFIDLTETFLVAYALSELADIA
jgi:hypothetical protein